MKIVRNVSEAEWWSWVEGRDVTFYQTPHWAKLLVDSFPDATVETCFFELPDGARVLVPLIRRQRLRGLVASLESMPFGTYGGFVADRELARTEMLDMIDNLRRSHPMVARLAIFPNPMGCHPIPEDIFACQNFVHFLRLDDGYDRIWKSRFTHSVRRSIRKALRQGVVAELTTDAEDYAAFARLYHLTAERWERKPPFGGLFFDNLSRLDRGCVQLWVARVDGDVAAGLIIFNYGVYQSCYFGAFDRAYRSYRPNSLLFAEAMKWGARRGMQYFNFSSSAGVKGVEEFKSSFGTQRLFFNFFLYEHVALRALHAVRS